MRRCFFLMSIFLIQSAYSSIAINWELLKTLEVDKSNKVKPLKPEIKKVIKSEVSLKGFMMPIDYDSKAVSEFLFMPYIPSCMHVPPPPANQLIFVKMKKGVSVVPSFAPVEIVGKLFLEENKELESSYKIEGIKLNELNKKP